MKPGVLRCPGSSLGRPRSRRCSAPRRAGAARSTRPPSAGPGRASQHPETPGHSHPPVMNTWQGPQTFTSVSSARPRKQNGPLLRIRCGAAMRAAVSHGDKGGSAGRALAARRAPLDNKPLANKQSRRTQAPADPIATKTTLRNLEAQ